MSVPRPTVLVPTTTAIPDASKEIGVYRLFFHPLAKFPGPPLAALTGWYEFYHDTFPGYGRFWKKIEEMHDVRWIVLCT